MTSELEKKVNQAIKLLQSVQKAYPNEQIEVCYSGGKDSDVILELAKMAKINYRAIYKNTTIDPPRTIAHVKSKGVEIRQPTMTFLDIIRKKNIPTMRARTCCRILKEYKILDVAIQGIRRSESQKRKKRYKATEPIKCRIYGSKKCKAQIILPILEWSDTDVAEFIKERNIKCHPLYYDEQGAFHVERRLGCLGCPLKSDRGLGDYKKYPNLAKAVIKACQTFLDTHPRSKSLKKFGDGYNIFFHNVFTKTYDEYRLKTSTDLFGFTPNIKQFLENYFNIKL